jgi:DUF4097 and DUF4098 domain-containing protein YvlB
MNCWVIVNKKTGKIVETNLNFNDTKFPETHSSKKSARIIRREEYDDNADYTIKKAVIEIKDW